jgi:hypothetical protein
MISLVDGSLMQRYPGCFMYLFMSELSMYSLLSYYMQKQIHMTFHHLFLHVQYVYQLHYYILILFLILHLGHPL